MLLALFIYFSIFSPLFKKEKKRTNEKKREVNKKIPRFTGYAQRKRRGRKTQDACILIMRSCLWQGSWSPSYCSARSICALDFSQPRKSRFKPDQGYFIAAGFSVTEAFASYASECDPGNELRHLPCRMWKLSWEPNQLSFAAEVLLIWMGCLRKASNNASRVTHPDIFGTVHGGSSPKKGWDFQREHCISG